MSDSLFSSRLARTRTRIHKPTCPNLLRSKSGLPWRWSDRHTDAEWLHLGWLVPCERCLWDLAAEQHRMRDRGEVITDEMAYFATESAE